MREYVLTLLAAAAVTYLLTPLVRRFATAIGAAPAARARDVHVVPTPRLGGVAMYVGLAGGLLVASRLPALNSAFSQTNMSKGLLLAGGLVVLMGAVDDKWGMGALSKMAGQVAAGVILVWSGAEVTWLPLPGGSTLSLTSDEQIAVTILVVVVTINAVNFIDGLDGLAAGVAGIGAIAFFVYYYTLTHRLGLPDQTGPALASAVLAGVCLGFLPHNFHPARIFMGDTGSMLIGLLLAYAPISSLASLDPGSLTDRAAYAAGTVNRFGAILPLLLPAAILLIPYTDLLMAVFRRTRAGMSPFAADRKHLHHRLLAIGHSHRTSVLIMYLWAALFSASVVWLSIVRTQLIVLAVVTAAAMLLLLLLSMPRLRPWSRSAADGPYMLGRRPGARPSAARRTAGARPVAARAGTVGAGAAGPLPAGAVPADAGPVSADAVPAGTGTAGAPGHEEAAPLAEPPDPAGSPVPSASRYRPAGEPLWSAPPAPPRAIDPSRIPSWQTAVPDPVSSAADDGPWADGAGTMPGNGEPTERSGRPFPAASASGPMSSAAGGGPLAGAGERWASNGEPSERSGTPSAEPADHGASSWSGDSWWQPASRSPSAALSRGWPRSQDLPAQDEPRTVPPYVPPAETPVRPPAFGQWERSPVSDPVASADTASDTGPLWVLPLSGESQSEPVPGAAPRPVPSSAPPGPADQPPATRTAGPPDWRGRAGHVGRG